MSIPEPTWATCKGETHFSNAMRCYRRGIEWRRCKRCGKPPEDAVQFGQKITNVYCLLCTCFECGIELEGYEEGCCTACMEKAETKS